MVKRGRSRTSRLHPLSRATVLHGRCGLGAQNFGGVVRVPQGYALSCYPMYVYNTGNIEQGPKPYVIVKRQSVESPIFYSAVTVAHCFLWGAWPGANFCCVWSPLCHDLLRSCQDWPLHLRNFHSWSLETACLAGDLAGPSHYLY